MAQTRYCRRHSDVATSLSCNKCDDPICPRCMIETPVGFRCRDCARLRQLPTFDVKGAMLARAILVSLAIGIVGGVVVTLLSGVPLLDAIALVGTGYFMGEGIGASVNRKRSRTLRYVAAGGMLVAMGIIISYSATPFRFTDILGAIVAFYLAMSPFR